MRLPVLITGATGFLGRAIAIEMVCAGYAVHALVREHSDRAVLDGLGVVFHEGSLGDRTGLLRACESVRAAAGDSAGSWVIHSAAALGYRRADRALQQSVNVEGTRNLMAAAAAAGLQRCLHVSSIVTVAWEEPRGSDFSTEDSRWNGSELGVEYVQTKREAEVLALEHCDRLDVRVVNPGAIFGAGGPESNTQRLLLALAQGGIGPWAPPGGMSVVGVRDTARGVRLALELGKRGRRYLLVDEYLDTYDLCQRVGVRMVEMGIEPRLPSLRVSPALWPWVVRAAKALERVHEPHLTSSRALQMVGPAWRARSDRARAELGWEPQSFDGVLGEALTDLRQRGLIS